MAEVARRRRHWLRWVVLAWLVLLFVSDIVRWVHPWSPSLREGEQVAIVAAIRDTTPLPGHSPVHLVYQ
ncbi:MAG: hypothetical protein ACHQ2E_12250, partial [Gemmatimonadales bacterium]